MLDISSVREGEVIVLTLEGRLDSATSDDLDFAAEDHVTGPNRVLLDLTGLKYVSSAGLRSCLMLAKKLQRNQGQFALCGLNEAVREVFDIAGFSQILKIAPDREAGLKLLA